MLTLHVLEEQATLNDFKRLDNVSFIGGSDAVIVTKVFDTDLEIRRILDDNTKAIFIFQNSDTTELEIEATFRFDPQDRSIIEVELTAAQTQLVISQNLIVRIEQYDDLGLPTPALLSTEYAILQFGLRRTLLQSGC